MVEIRSDQLSVNSYQELFSLSEAPRDQWVKNSENPLANFNQDQTGFFFRQEGE
ncbi:MAG: hypothetical protein U5L00_07680 [Desulfovermiculus sp.]|nr:hypothetical protein [Desulfovermiculus sp.]